MAAFMNRNENEIEPLKQVAAEEGIPDQQGVECQPAKKRPARNRFPVFFERIKEWKTLAERFRNFHEQLILPAPVAGRSAEPRVDSPPGRHSFRDGVHNFPAAVHAIAARKIFWVACAVLRVHYYGAILANFDSFAGAQKIRRLLLSDGADDHIHINRKAAVGNRLRSALPSRIG